MNSKVVSFPLGTVLDMRDESFRQSEIHRINEKIRAKESEIARIGHEIWLLRLERTRYEEI